MSARVVAAPADEERMMRAVVAVELGADAVRILDQRGLPARVEWIRPVKA